MSNLGRSVFCKIEELNGSCKVYRFPNDLQSALLEYAQYQNLNDLLVGALINYPTKEKFGKKYRPVLHVAMIKEVFISSKCRVKKRTRGQFLTSDRWAEDDLDIRFLLHDHSSINKLRIIVDIVRWRRRLKKRRLFNR